MMMNVQQKLAEEFERVIIARETLRAQIKQRAAMMRADPAQSQHLIEVLAGLNDILSVARDALGTCDALASIKAVKLLEEIQ